jgi:hypothetical protein
VRRLVRGSDRPGVATTQTRPRAAVPRPQPRSADRGGDRQRSPVGLCAPSSLLARDTNIVLLTTQIKHWLLSPPDDHPFKLKVTFCVRGVISPLLANIYMHRFIKAFRRYGLDHRYGAVLVNYADDFVVLCRHDASEVLETTRRWMASIGLTLDESKTRVCNARCEPFDFLGYTFGPMYSPRTGGRYNGARPSKKAVASIKARIRRQLRPGNQAPWADVAERLNRTVRGWAAYFSYGSVSKARHVVDLYVYYSVRNFLRRRHKVGGLGSRQFPAQRVFGELGVISFDPTYRRSTVHASM